MARPCIPSRTALSILVAALWSTTLLFTAQPVEARQADTVGLSEWEVEDGFRLDVHARGLRIPTGIAFLLGFVIPVAPMLAFRFRRRSRSANRS